MRRPPTGGFVVQQLFPALVSVIAGANLAPCRTTSGTTPSHSPRLVIIAADMVQFVADDEQAIAQAECLRQLRIGLPEGGYNIIAVLSADTVLSERLA